MSVSLSQPVFLFPFPLCVLSVFVSTGCGMSLQEDLGQGAWPLSPALLQPAADHSSNQPTPSCSSFQYSTNSYLPGLFTSSAPVRCNHSCGNVAPLCARENSVLLLAYLLPPFVLVSRFPSLFSSHLWTCCFSVLICLLAACSPRNSVLNQPSTQLSSSLPGHTPAVGSPASTPPGAALLAIPSCTIHIVSNKTLLTAHLCLCA